MRTGIEVRYLGEVEYAQWGQLVAESPHGSIYSTPEYLECLCSAVGGSFRILGCFRGDQLVGGIGLYIQNERRGRCISNRWLLLYYNGIVLKSFGSSNPYRRASTNLEILSAIEEYLSRGDFDQISLHNRHTLDDFRIFLKKGWSIQPEYTYVVSISDTEKMWGRVDQNLRRLVRRCQDSGAQLSTEVDFDRFYQMHVATHERKGSPIYLPQATFRNFVDQLVSKNLARLYHAVLPNGTSVAAQLVLLGRHPVTHTVCAAADAAYLQVGSNPFLRVKVFEDLSRQGYEANDLTSASLVLPEVTRFKAQLGGDLVTTFAIARARSRQERAFDRVAQTAVADPSKRLVDNSTAMRWHSRHSEETTMNEERVPREWRKAPRYCCFSELFHGMQVNHLNLAFLAPGKQPLTYGGLCRHIEAIISFLNGHGLGRNDRIGVVIPEGLDMAVVFLGITACATFVPFMRHNTAEELEFLMQEIGIKALVVNAGADHSALSVAAKKAIPIIEVKPLGDSTDTIELLWKQGSRGVGRTVGFAEPEDIAMVLTTSGTTSRPKLVPLTQANIFVSAHYNADALRLDHADRSLHVLPMAHIAGLVSSIIAPLSTGGSIVCTSGFSLEEFPGWLEEFQPTWYSAVPPMHQAVVELMERKELNPATCPLRFIRAVAGRLAEPLIEKLEAAFKIPVLEAYGMTEALAIASTPLYPYKRKPGSVGVTLCPEVTVMADDGALLAAGETGEIVVRGPHVFEGYENSPEANQLAFVNGWFRTGDIGHIDDEGYLFVTGRLKEVINRGGEKVAPQEVETVLLAHPAVQDACVFRVLHSRLGEDVAAAVVLRNRGIVQEGELRQYVAARLAYYKVPNQIIVVESIPRNEMGKLRRDDMSQYFEHLLEAEFVAPVTEAEIILARIWSEVLGRSPVGRNDDFFALGGDSLLATRLMHRIRSEFGLELPVLTIFENGTLRELAKVIAAPPLTESGDQELADLIEEAERMTDEEARE